MLFDRQYKLLIGRTSDPAAVARLNATRAEAEAALAQTNNPNLTTAEQLALANRQETLTRSLLAQQGLNNQRGFEITELRVQFFIQKNLTRNPNKNTLQIYNLQPTTRALIEKPDVRCYLHAGYSEEQGPLLIYQGNVMFAYSSYTDDGNVITECELGDGHVEFRDTTISLGYGRGVQSRRILEDIAAAMGLSIIIPNNLNNRSWNNGFSFHGAARSALDRVTAGTGLSWSIQNGALQVIQRGGSNTRSTIVLSPESGLIGSPERERQSAAEVARVRDRQTNRNRTIVSAAPQFDGWRIRSLLMPDIGPGDTVRIESRTVTGNYIASEVVHKGDSHEGDWQTEIKLVDVNTAQRIKEEEAKRVQSEATRRTRAASRAASTTPTTPVTPRPPT